MSIIIPTFNGASRIGRCLDALEKQIPSRSLEILVVDDGSTDNTCDVVGTYAGVRLIRQSNAGPAVARNRGAAEAKGSVILFTDDDCVPVSGWLDAMLAPFADPDVIGAKGTYRTRQTSFAARFVQLEYEDKYRLMSPDRDIDFIDTYSAAFRRDRFVEMDGYDRTFPVACAEDIELSYRMSARGWSMRFVPNAIVYHTHPATMSSYLKKKYKFAYWRVLAVSKNPSKGVSDSHTPQIMKLQMLLLPALLAAAAYDVIYRPALSVTLIVLATFLLSTLPFALRAFGKDPLVGFGSPVVLAARACAQFFGVAVGSLNVLRVPAQTPSDLSA